MSTSRFTQVYCIKRMLNIMIASGAKRNSTEGLLNERKKKYLSFHSYLLPCHQSHYNPMPLETSGLLFITARDGVGIQVHWPLNCHGFDAINETLSFVAFFPIELLSATVFPCSNESFGTSFCNCWITIAPSRMQRCIVLHWSASAQPLFRKMGNNNATH